MFAALLIIVLVGFLFIQRMGGTTKTVAKAAEAPRQLAEAAPGVTARVMETSSNVASVTAVVSKAGAAKAVEGATAVGHTTVAAAKAANTGISTFRSNVAVERARIKKSDKNRKKKSA